MIWEESDYQSILHERMENEARQWVKNKIDKSKGIIRAGVIYD